MMHVINEILSVEPIKSTFTKTNGKRLIIRDPYGVEYMIRILNVKGGKRVYRHGKAAVGGFKVEGEHLTTIKKATYKDVMESIEAGVIV